jgi:hypothetical protein
MKYWSRQDTKNWVEQLEDRIDDIAHYLDKTIEWCEENDIENEKTVFMCSFITCIWVSQLRDEPITFTELMEMMGIDMVEIEEEKFYELDAKYINLTHQELLEQAVITFENDDE